MDLSKTTKALCCVLATTAFFAILGVAGILDRREQIIYNMPQEAYEAIYIKLGHGCTDKQIEEEYLNNKEYYQSLNW